MKDEIGIEQEVWLLDKNNRIVEPGIYSFPHDEFGFLIEIRSRPSTKVQPILDDVLRLHKAFKYQANLFDLKIVVKDSMPMDQELIDRLRIKYNYYNLRDTTVNLKPGTVLTHATGIIGKHLTAGTHVHFSRKKDDGTRIQLPIRRIVREMDNHFVEEIYNARRIFGEFEIKEYGFEYRSLPASIDIKKAVEYSFKLLKES